ncbi:MAG: MBL fold metallo-hydrolase, partial [Schwartzia sp.]|nr:MBL fold metallo-hydrolase [Schwartzia sp. (in: firmicutes)]
KETAQASEDVGARQVVTSHNGKFALALHPWKEPYLEMEKYSAGRSYEWLTPRIGETVRIGEKGQTFSRWWEEMK